MTRVFISYRRADSQTWADRIYPVLVKAFGKDNVFKDIDSISAGQNFRAAIEKAIIQSDVVLILIGRQWVTITDNQGRKRLDNPDDAVRLEVEMALRHANVVIPVAVDAAQIPSSSDLPPSFNNLPFLNGASIRNDPDFDHDMTRLIRAIRERVGGSSLLPDPTSVSRFRTPVMIGIIILTLLVMGLALLNRQLPPSNVPTLTQQIGQIPSDIPTITNSAVPTLSSTEVEGTIQGEMDVAQTDIANTQSAVIALKTANAVATDARSSSDKTATATQWTPTPTIDVRATDYARLAQTQDASTRVVLDQTATATRWTPTPTPTSIRIPSATNTRIPSPVPSDTPHPTQTATHQLTITLTPTSVLTGQPIVIAHIKGGIVIRKGPSQLYDAAGTGLKDGEHAVILGKAIIRGQLWYYIDPENPQISSGWIWSGVNGLEIQGDVDNIPSHVYPPEPTLTPTIKPTNTP